MDISLDPATVAYIGILLGVFLRTLLPYIQKAKESTQPPVKFDWRYALTAVSVAITTFVATNVVFATFTIPDGANVYVFINAFMVAWGANDALNRIAT